MLQRTTISPATLDLQQANLRQILGGSRIGRLGQLLREMLWLPSDIGSFLLFLGVISLLTAGLMLHLRLSVDILETRLLLENKLERQAEIERQSAEIVWQIGQAISLERVRQRAAELGYVVPTKRYYVEASSIAVQKIASDAVDKAALSDAKPVLQTAPAEPLASARAAQNPFLDGSLYGTALRDTLQDGWQDLNIQLTTWWQGR